MDKDLNFSIPIDSTEEVVEAPKTHLFDNTFLAGSAHPFICLLHISLKALGLVWYFFLNLFLGNFILTFLLILGISAADFWVVQNTTGPKLVGLKWKYSFNGKGDSEWEFEKLEGDTNAVDTWIFWMGLFIAPAIWVFFLFANLVTFALLWVSFI